MINLNIIAILYLDFNVNIIFKFKIFDNKCLLGIEKKVFTNNLKRYFIIKV